MDIPIPNPAMAPPISEQSSLPLDKARFWMISCGRYVWNKFRQMDASMMAYMVLAPNFGPMMNIDMIRSMALMTR